ncbi:uncharacterized protein PRCAT00002652001 [Priceomyces carsonii]|uniref:uncharacterized protein n=1 Tax=Priceomyces carsonii TaxID=28549 RepID=UPI002EDA0D5C|nr:unnamed protein product [Priceomyces carsonii]
MIISNQSKGLLLNKHNTFKAAISRFSSSGPTRQPLLSIDDDLMDKDYQEEVSKHLKDLKAYPSYSNILNPQHFYQNQVLMEYLQKRPHPVSLRQLAGFGKTLTKQKILSSANFVRLELPIRLAMRIRDLQTLPFGVVNNVHFAKIYESYYHLFNAFRKIPTIKTLDDNQKFCRTLSQMLDDHVFNLSNLMMGALEISIVSDLSQEELDQFMSSILRSRISRRVIVEEHLSLTENYKTSPYSSKPPDFIGEIFHQCRAADHLNIVGDLLKDSMMDGYHNKEHMPDLELHGDLNATCPFLVPHLHYLFGEILRNSFEATIKTHGKDLSTKLPPIKILIIDSSNEIVFKISDFGGGMKHEEMKDIWSFKKKQDLAKQYLSNFHALPGLSILPDPMELTNSSQSYTLQILKEPILGRASSIFTKQSTLETLIKRPHEYRLGLGLPMCKVYADYWNGDLLMNSIQGYGTDTCLRLTKLGYYSNNIQLDRA